MRAVALSMYKPLIDASNELDVSYDVTGICKGYSPHGSAKSHRTLEWLHWSHARFLTNGSKPTADG